MTDLACQQTITALAAGRILDAPPLVTCTVDQLAQVVPGLDDAEDNLGAIGRNGSQISWRAVRQGIAGQMLRVWHDGDCVLAIEVERPDTPGGWPELRDKLGTPSQKFDVVRPVVAAEQRLCFYGARGVATQSSATGERLDRVMAYPPTTAGDFITHLAMSLVPPRERTVD
jgi:hypothetical protein